MAENVPKLGKETASRSRKPRIQVPNKRSPEIHTKTHFLKMSKVKDKERILEAIREKQLVTYKRILIRLSADFSAEIL